MGFAVPRCFRFERWSLTPPFHPYPILANRAVSSLWHFPSGRLTASPPACISRTNRSKVTRHRALRCSDFPPPFSCYQNGSDPPPFQNRPHYTRKINRSNDGKAPNPKHQAPEKLQAPMRTACRLRLENWSFSGAWMLVLGALIQIPFPTQNLHLYSSHKTQAFRHAPKNELRPLPSPTVRIHFGTGLHLDRYFKNDSGRLSHASRPTRSRRRVH